MADEASDSWCCCRIRLPTIPLKWLLFIDFAFTFGTTIVYFADIVTDIITLKMYYEQEWYSAFGLSIGFIVGPSILLAILECQFLIKAYGKNVKWGMVVLRTVLNVPFQLTVIWYHIKLSYNYLRTWLDHINEKNDNNAIRDHSREMSVSNLADVDDRLHTMRRNEISTVVPAPGDNGVAYPVHSNHTWWKQLTREQWLSHLNKMKLSESMLESLPQLLINLYLIVKYPNTSAIQYISASISYLSLCGGIVRYDKTRKDNEADRLMVDRTLLHSRAFVTRLEWPQMLFLSLYKGCFLAARILAFVYFTVYFAWYVLILILVHWAVLMGYLVWLWYPTDIHKKTRQLVQADYKFRAYMFLSQDIMGVFHNSLMGIFINVRPHNYAFLGQPYCYLFWYYLIFVIENIILFLLPGVVYSIYDEEDKLLELQYYIVLIIALSLNVLGAVFCTIYYFGFHKMKAYTRNAYPVVGSIQNFCCCGSAPGVLKGWTVCKQAETSEIFYLRKDKLKIYKNSYSTVVRSDRRQGRNLECFVDERGKIFYARRKLLFRKVPTVEEEERVEMRGKSASRESLDALDERTSVGSPKPGSERVSETIPKSELDLREDSPLPDNKETDKLLSASELPALVMKHDTKLPESQVSHSSRNQSARSKTSQSIQSKNAATPTNRSVTRSPPSSVASSTRRINETPSEASSQRLRGSGRSPRKSESAVRESSGRSPASSTASSNRRKPNIPNGDEVHSERSYRSSKSRTSPGSSSRSQRTRDESDPRQRSKERKSNNQRITPSSDRTPSGQKSSMPPNKSRSPSSEHRRNDNDKGRSSRRSQSPNDRRRLLEDSNRHDRQSRGAPVGQTWI